jgi:MinD superfamily P-loop ATPase
MCLSVARTFTRRHGAPYVIIEGCIECGICERVCPYDAIFMSDDFEYVVSGEQCPGCHRCFDPCPVDTIVPMDDPRAARVRASNEPHVLHDWRSLVDAQGRNA